MLHHAALVSELSEISFSELTQVGAALQKQVSRDLSPIWKVEATVDTFHNLKDVPTGYWPIIIEKDIDQPNVAGFHTDKDGQPIAFVLYNNSWPLTASHECLEMLANPGHLCIPGPSIMSGQGRVEYLKEVCGPCENPDFAYTVNGVMVSDFITPQFFDPVRTTSVRYSFTGAVKGPREVLKGGYLTWRDPVTRHWWQVNFLESEKEFTDLGVQERLTESLRATMDRLMPRPKWMYGLKPKDKRLLAAQAAKEDANKSASSKAKAWRAQIEALKTKTRRK